MVLKKVTLPGVRGELMLQLETNELSPVIKNMTFLNLDSNTKDESYAWIGDTPQMREWIGQRHIQQLSEYDYTIRNRKFEVSLGVYQDEIEDDKVSQVQGRIDSLGTASEEHWNDMISDLMIASTSTLCYDGQFFFDSDHPAKDQKGNDIVQSNKITFDISDAPTGGSNKGQPDNPSPEIMAMGIMAAVRQIWKMRSDTGRLLNRNARKFYIVVPDQLYSAATLAMTQEYYGIAVSNILKAQTNLSFELLVDPNLTWTDQYAVFRGDGAGFMKPFVLQQQGKVNYEEVTHGSKHYFDTKQHLFGYDVRRGGGYGLYQHACHVTNVA